jgi:hypothetical protein
MQNNKPRRFRHVQDFVLSFKNVEDEYFGDVLTFALDSNQNDIFCGYLNDGLFQWDGRDPTKKVSVRKLKHKRANGRRIENDPILLHRIIDMIHNSEILTKEQKESARSCVQKCTDAIQMLKAL